MGRTPIQTGVDFGTHFWDLVPFTMQMAFVVISGYVVASSKPVNRLIVMSVTICYYSTPNADKAKTAEMDSINYGEGENIKEKAKAEKLGEWLEYSPILTLVIVSI